MERAFRSTTDRQPNTVISRLQARLSLWLQNTRTRQQLARLGERELADAGIDSCQRARELSKPFWR